MSSDRSRVYTYGVLLAAAYLLGLKLAMVRAKARGLDANRVLDLGIYIIISALVGAKLLLLITDFRTFTAESARAAHAGAIRRRVLRRPDPRRRRRALVHPQIGLPLWTTCDVFAPGIALGHVVGRFGCLFAGCCYGKPTTLPWGITFTDPFAAANVGTPLGVPLHPTQLYEAGAELLILASCCSDRAERAAVPGPHVLALHAALRVSRFIIEFYRGDERGTVGDVLDVAVHFRAARAAGDRHAGRISSRVSTPEPKRARKAA